MKLIKINWSFESYNKKFEFLSTSSKSVLLSDKTIYVTVY